MAIRHTINRIMPIARQSGVAQSGAPQPTNRQLSRMETDMLTIPPDGQTPDRATVLGQPNGEPPVQVYSTGMFKSLRKGETRWVTGTDVETGLSSGVIVQIGGLAPVDYAEPTVDVTTVQTPAPLPEPTEVDRALVDMSKSELVKVAQAVGLEGRSAMDKSELYEHLRHHPGVPDHLR